MARMSSRVMGEGSPIEDLRNRPGAVDSRGRPVRRTADTPNKEREHGDLPSGVQGRRHGRRPTPSARPRWPRGARSSAASATQLVDAGNPFGPAATVAPGGAISDGAASGLSGYSIISSGSLSDATATAKGCPVLSQGGSVEVHEIFPVM